MESSCEETEEVIHIFSWQAYISHRREDTRLCPDRKIMSKGSSSYISLVSLSHRHNRPGFHTTPTFVFMWKPKQRGACILTCQQLYMYPSLLSTLVWSILIKRHVTDRTVRPGWHAFKSFHCVLCVSLHLCLYETSWTVFGLSFNSCFANAD